MNSSDSMSGAFWAFVIINVALVVVFLFIAANISAIRKASDIGLRGLGHAGQFCLMPCPTAASVCHRCGRDIGSWIQHGGVFWTKAGDGSWVWLGGEAWLPPDDRHTPPT